MSRPPISGLGPQRYELAECPRWVGDTLVYVDLLAGDLWSLPAPGAVPEETAGPRRLVDLDVPLGAVAPVRGQPGTWLAGVGDGIGLISEGSSEISWLGRPRWVALARCA